MEILVTGGAGFIGKFLCESLLKKNHSVTIFDNFSNSTKESISSLLDLGVKVIEGDITKIQEIESATKDIEAVIHLAAKISVNESVKNPKETFRINVDGTRNVIKSCIKNNVKKIIAASSAAVYGETETNQKNIDENVKTNPISPYGHSKLKMEEILKDSNTKKELTIIILRFFNIYGRGQSDEYAGVITKFMKNIIKNRTLEIYGNGEQTRDFVSIYDVVDSFHNSLSYKKNGIFNIGSGKSISIKKLAEILIFMSGKNIDIKFLDAKKDEIRFSQADISSAKRELGYFPKIELDQNDEFMKYDN